MSGGFVAAALSAAPAAVLVLSMLPSVPGARAQALSESERCMALSMYWEAKGEGAEGMRAVGAVILNRMASPEFPADACAVVFEGGETPPCQFSWWCDGESDEPVEPQPWATARELAVNLLDGAPADPTGGALFFHHAQLEVPWAMERERTVRVGDHIYYR